MRNTSQYKEHWLRTSIGTEGVPFPNTTGNFLKSYTEKPKLRSSWGDPASEILIQIRHGLISCHSSWVITSNFWLFSESFSRYNFTDPNNQVRQTTYTAEQTYVHIQVHRRKRPQSLNQLSLCSTLLSKPMPKEIPHTVFFSF